MYFRFETRLEFPALARALCVDLTEDAIDWDSENVYEWMYVDLPQLDFSLNISREHGWADIDDETLNQYQDNEQELKQLVQPGPTYVFGWDQGYVDKLPDSLSSYIADRLSVDVCVFDRKMNVDIPDGIPFAVVNPQHKSGS